MSKPRVLLTVAPELFRDALRELLEHELDIEVVGRMYDPFGLSQELDRTKSSIVIHASAYGDTLFHRCTSWMNRHPDVLLISISTNSVCVYRHGTVRSTVATCDLSSTIECIRQVLSQPRTKKESDNVKFA